MADIPDVVELNLLGKHYWALKKDLVKEPDSDLGKWFSGKEPIHKDAHGRYFINYRPNKFGKLLRYLRESILPSSKDALEDLLEDARALKLTILEVKINEILVKREEERKHKHEEKEKAKEAHQHEKEGAPHFTVVKNNVIRFLNNPSAESYGHALDEGWHVISETFDAEGKRHLTLKKVAKKKLEKEKTIKVT